MTEKKVTKSVRIPNDIAQRVEEYAEEHDITESDALRRLILYGLEREENGYHETLVRIKEEVTTPWWKRLRNR